MISRMGQHQQKKKNRFIQLIKEIFDLFAG